MSTNFFSTTLGVLCFFILSQIATPVPAFHEGGQGLGCYKNGIPAAPLQIADCTNTHQTDYLFVVTTDGLRWQEVFRGADAQLADASHPYLLGETPDQRRQLLMPFFWSKMVKNGQIYGNRDLNSCVSVANSRAFSYPGYSELFCGYPDDKRIWSNLPLPNPNPTWLATLSQTECFEGKVAAFGSWSVFSAILDKQRCGFLVNVGFDQMPDSLYGDLNQEMKQCARPWGSSVRPDSLTWAYARRYLLQAQPRVMHIGYGETDEYAHESNYPAYLKAAHEFDGYLQDLWETLQSNPTYRNKSTIIVTTDHGRGRKKRNWSSHRAGIGGSEEIWFAVMGPDTPAGGEMRDNQHTLAQLTRTGAAFLGLDLAKGCPAAERITATFAPCVGGRPAALASRK